MNPLDMQKTIIKPLAMSLVFFIAFSLSSCADIQPVTLPTVDDYDMPMNVSENKNLKLGICAGPYGDMFMEAIYPMLEQKGYAVELVLYDDYVQPNLALSNHEIDLNMFQHYIYLNDFKAQYDLDLSAIAKIPTASMGIFSNKYSSLDDIENGASVTISNDSTNLTRSLLVLEDSGIIKIDPYIDKTKATIENISGNDKNLRFILLEPQNLTSSLSEYDLSVINGNFALASGLKLNEALYNEVLAENYFNLIAVRTEDLSMQFVQDIIDAVETETFRSFFRDVDGEYDGFQLPRYLKRNR